MFAPILLFACLDPVQKDGSDGTGTGDTGSGGGASLTIAEIRGGGAADGESVTVSGALVSSPLTRASADSGRSDGFFIQDPAGGEQSGLYVWSQGQFGDELTAREGDEVTISGQISDYYGWTELVVGDATSIQVTGSGTLPAPADLGDGAGVDWDVWESVPVKLTNQAVTAVNEFGTGTLSAGIGLDDGFTYNDYDCRGTFASTTGIIFYQYEAWTLNNRTTDELAGYGAPEAVPATIQQVRTGEVCGPVHVEGVVSNSPSFGEKDGHTYVIVQDPAGGENSGIVAYVPAAFTDYPTGTMFTIDGIPSNYKGLMELYVGDTGALTATGTGVAMVVTLTEAVADWTPWQSSLIQLQGVTAGSVDEYGTVLTDKGVYIDNLFMNFDAQDGDTWSSVVGPLYYTSYDDVPKFLVEPRTEADLVP